MLGISRTTLSLWFRAHRPHPLDDRSLRFVRRSKTGSVSASIAKMHDTTPGTTGRFCLAACRGASRALADQTSGMWRRPTHAWPTLVAQAHRWRGSLWKRCVSRRACPNRQKKEARSGDRASSATRERDRVAVKRAAYQLKRGPTDHSLLPSPSIRMSPLMPQFWFNFTWAPRRP